MSVAELSREEVARRLEPYDIVKNPRLAALFAPGQYPHTRRCAILVPLFFSSGDGQLHVLLTQRASTLRSHASNVAFPGGAQDPGDADDTHTALREAHEEVGLDPNDVTVVAHLPPMFVRTSNSVFPVVGFIPNDFRPTPNPHEVALVFSLPLRSFLDSKVTFSSYKVHGKTFRTPFLIHVIAHSPLLIWGVTCSLCIAVARAVLGPFKRYRLLLGNRSGEEEVSERREERDVGEDDDCDGNVFGDFEMLYHILCKTIRPSGRL